MKPDLPSYLPVHRVAKRLNLKPDTVRILARAGKLPGFKRKGSHLWMFKAEDIERLISERKKTDG